MTAATARACLYCLGGLVLGMLSSPVFAQSADDDKQSDYVVPTHGDEAISGFLAPLVNTQADFETASEPSNGDQTAKSKPNGPIPGVIAAIMVDGKPIRVGAAGVRKWNSRVPLEAGDLVHLGSCTKAMTATMIARLVEQGKLSYDTTIAEGLPDLVGDIHADYHTVTLRQLLRHRGGVPRDTFWAGFPDEPIVRRRERVVLSSLKRKPRKKPDGRYAYSNLGYCVAGMMAAKREGLSWEQLMQRELFDVLGLTTAGFGAPGTPGKIDQPWGHIVTERAAFPRQGDNPPPLGPAGTIHMTMADWAKFGLEHAECSQNPIVTEESLRELHTGPRPDEVPDYNPNHDQYACGWIVTKRPWAKGRVLTHSGSNTLWFCTIWVAPETKTVYMAACNGGTGKHVSSVVDQAIVGLIGLKP